LETLDLSNNAITIFTGNYLPKIQTLNLSNNPTIDFYELLYYKELKYVTISSVPLHVKLSNLHLNWIEFTAYESEIEEFYNNSFPNLRVLSFRKNPLTSFKGDSYLPELNTLNLENCKLNTFI
jgi:Leucine-rich repeat (LRR) protein